MWSSLGHLRRLQRTSQDSQPFYWRLSPTQPGPGLRYSKYRWRRGGLLTLTSGEHMHAAASRKLSNSTSDILRSRRRSASTSVDSVSWARRYVANIGFDRRNPSEGPVVLSR